MKRERKAYSAYVASPLRRLRDRLKFLDAIGAHLGWTRLYGRAAPGQRVVEGRPGYSGPPDTIIAALSLAGVSAPWMLESPRDGAAFRAYVAPELAPTLPPGDIVIVDNLSAHNDAQARAVIAARGAGLVCSLWLCASVSYVGIRSKA